MSFYKLIIRSLKHYKKQHFAVFLGTLVGTAVLTGALIIGDSVRFSLRNIVEKRLGKTEYVLNTNGHFVHSGLAADLASQLNVSATPLLMLQGIAVNTESNTRISNTQVLGIEDGFNKFSPNAIPKLSAGEAIISSNMAQRLNIKTGDDFLLRVENATIIPLNTPLVPENMPSVALRLTVKAVANDSCMGRFSLKNNQSAPYNVFISREYLAEKLELSGLANIILLTGEKNSILKPDEIDSALAKSFQLVDAGIKIRDLADLGKFELISNRIFIDNAVSTAIQNTAIPYEKVLTYLANRIRCREKQTPYSFVAAVSYPLVPNDLKKDEIVINEWISKDLGVSAGDSVALDYYVIGPLRTLKENSRRFMVKQVYPVLAGISGRSLMPSIPGLADAGSCRDWNSGVPIDFKRIRNKDEKYWDDYKGTPKAFISIAAGIELWGNSFGNYTAFRFNKKDVFSSDSLEKLILNKLNYKDMGFAMIPVHNEGIHGANNSVDFGELFLSLSFFIIVAALLLTLLVHILNTETRSTESAILSGLGFSRTQIIRFRFAESFPVIILGGIAGAFAGILYNYGLIAELNSVWHDAVRERMLQVDINITTLAIGAISGIILALLAIYFVTRRKLRQPVANLIKNAPGDFKSVHRNRKLSHILALAGLGGAILLVCISIITSSYENAGLFLSAGGLFLLGSTALLSINIHKPIWRKQKEFGGITWLAIKNAGYNKGRSLTIALVLAIGTFIIILTGSYRKTYNGDENLRNSGTGGFTQWAETTMPVPFNLNSSEGRKNLLLNNEKDLDSIHFSQLHTFDGDDASCLNLSQVKHPRLLGVNPDEFDKKQAFSFIALQEGIQQDHPWKELDNIQNDLIPAYADQTVIIYGLKKSIGDTLSYLGESGKTLKLRIVGGLDNSIFQGSILISDKAFIKYFPSSGSKVLLIESPKARQEAISNIIQSSLSDYGVTLVPATERLAEFNSVENTYLSVFMVLGGLGFLIGILGLGIILYRTLLERQHELALLISLGYKKKQVFQLICTEYIYLLVSGLVCGLLSALIGIFPSLISPAFNIQGRFLGILILVILVLGIFLVWFFTRLAMKKNRMEVLREE